MSRLAYNKKIIIENSVQKIRDTSIAVCVSIKISKGGLDNRNGHKRKIGKNYIPSSRSTTLLK